MDYLILMLCYFLVFITCVACYFYGHTPLLSTGPIGKLKHLVEELFMFVIPERLRDAVYDGLNSALHTKNHVLQFLFGTLVVLGHAVWVIDMLPILYVYHPNTNHTLIPMMVMFANLLFFHLSCNSDPGEITPATFSRYQNAYSYDGRLYLPGICCRTCDLLKPARSKHCSICNRCVHRFDHHCIWTNNDVGGLNHRYFLLFLITLVIIAIEGITVGGYSLWLYADHRKLMFARVLLDDGSTKPVTLFIVFQHLFMTFPRLVFLVIALVLLLPLIGAFTSYHTFLIVTNQTTNERYKTPEIEKQSEKQNSSKRHSSQSKLLSETKSNKQSEHPRRPYDKGLIYNINDAFFVKSLKKKKKR